MKSAHLILIPLITVGLLAGCSKKEEPAPPPQANGTDTTPEVKPAITDSEPEVKTAIKAAPLDGLTYVKGNSVAFQEGNVYVVEFWATWCPPCRESIPHLTEIQKQFKDKGVTVIGISNESVDTVKPFIEKMAKKMEYTVAVDAEGKVGNGYMTAFKQNGIPTAFVVDGKGNVAWVGHPMDGLDTVLEQIVAGQALAK